MGIASARLGAVGARAADSAIAVTLPMSRIGPADSNITPDAGSAIGLKLTLDACIDGSRTEGVLSGGLNVNAGGSLKANGQELTLRITGKGKMSHAQVPLK